MLPALLAALNAMEKIRSEWWLNKADEAVIRARKPLQEGVAGDQDGYFPLARKREADSERGVSETRELWSAQLGNGVSDIHVEDVAPVAAETIRSLVRKGYLIGKEGLGYPPRPLTVFHWRRPFEAYAGRWRVEANAEDKWGGAWVVAGQGDVLAWAITQGDARYLVACANALIRLELDVRRYGGPPNPTFPNELATGGLLNLIRTLVSSVVPAEPWEKMPPRELVERGKRLLDEVASFCDATKPHRFGIKR